MALTQVSRGLLSTSIVDNGNATAITIDSSEDTTFTGRIKNTRGNHQAQLYGTGDNVILRHDSNSSGLLALSRAGSLDVVLDASGNLLVGKSSPNTNTAGLQLESDGYLSACRDGGNVVLVNRKSSDGALVTLQKDGTTVGSIQSRSGLVSTIILDPRTNGAGLTGSTNGVLPVDQTGSGTNNVELGSSGSRFNTLYLGNDIAHLDTAGNARLLYDRSSNLLGNAGTDGTFANLLVGTTTLADVNNLATNHLFEGANSTVGAGAVGVYNNTGTANAPALVVLNRDASTDTSNRFVQFYANVTSSGSTAMGGIVGNGASNVQFASISDVREKENITTISGSLSKINSLNPVEFDWIASGEHCKAGFVAQEVEAVFPEFVVENMASEGQEKRKGLTGGMTGGIVAHLVKAIQEQQETITALTARIEQLENN